MDEVRIGIRGRRRLAASIIVRHQHGRERVIRFRDDPELFLIFRVIHREETATRFQCLVVRLPIFRAAVPPVAIQMTFESSENFGGRQLGESVGGDDDLPEGKHKWPEGEESAESLNAIIKPFCSIVGSDVVDAFRKKVCIGDNESRIVRLEKPNSRVGKQWS